MRCKKSFSLLELIFAIFIGSIFFVYSFVYTKNLYELNEDNEKLAILKLDINSTKIILDKNKTEIATNLLYKDNKLYFKDSLLLENVTHFTKSKTNNFINIDIEVEKTIKQKWVFKL